MYRFFLRLRDELIECGESKPPVLDPVIGEFVSLLFSLELEDIEPSEGPWTDGDLPAGWDE